MQLKASATGWVELHLRANPWHRRRRYSETEWKERALAKGYVGINSILRDWVKGQVTAVETGIMPFRHVFLPCMLTESGKTVGELVDDRGSQVVGLIE